MRWLLPLPAASGGYIVGDTVQFTSLDPYKIKITGRLKHYMNAFGEEVIVDIPIKRLPLPAKKPAPW